MRFSQPHKTLFCALAILCAPLALAANADAAVARLEAKIEKLKDSATNKKETQSSKALSALAQTLAVSALAGDEAAEKDIEAALKALPDSWGGAKTHFGLYRSSADGALLPFAYRTGSCDMKLPPPLIIELSAASPRPHPLVWAGETIREPIIEAADKAITLYPYARGAFGYRDIGEADIRSAIKALEKLHRTDPDRRHLSGFGWGGWGVLRMAAATPDEWASIAPSGCYDYRGLMHYSWTRENIAGIPIVVYCGESDGLKYAKGFLIALEKLGSDTNLLVGRGIGHTMSPASREKAYAWMLGHKRRLGREFSYHMYDWDNRGRRGLTLFGDPEFMPRFHCKVEGHVVSVELFGADGLIIELGKGGLGLSEQVNVLVNGKSVYSGPVRRLKIGDTDELNLHDSRLR